MKKLARETRKTKKVPWDKIQSIKAVWLNGMSTKEICAAIKDKKAWGGKRPDSSQIVGTFHRYPEELEPCHLNRRGFAQGTKTVKKRKSVDPTPPIEHLADVNFPALMDRKPTTAERRYEMDKLMLKHEKTFETKGSMTSNLEPSRAVATKEISLPRIFGTGNTKFDWTRIDMPHKLRSDA